MQINFNLNMKIVFFMFLFIKYVLAQPFASTTTEKSSSDSEFLSTIPVMLDASHASLKTKEILIELRNDDDENDNASAILSSIPVDENYGNFPLYFLFGGKFLFLRPKLFFTLIHHFWLHLDGFLLNGCNLSDLTCKFQS